MKAVFLVQLEPTTIKTHVNVNVFKIVNVKLQEMFGMTILIVLVGARPKIVQKVRSKMAKTANANA